AGMRLTTMPAEHHDKVLAVTSHLPHLIAYTIVGTATELGDDLQSEVVAYSAGGFRDFTRIAASDPVMWRDIFLANREAVLELLQRFSEDLTGLQRAIRRGDGEVLHDWFTRTRAPPGLPRHRRAAAARAGKDRRVRFDRTVRKPDPAGEDPVAVILARRGGGGALAPARRAPGGADRRPHRHLPRLSPAGRLGG